MKSFISIIIPTFNRHSLLGETLDSILCQTNKNWECLVIDDGSSDYTPELMEFYLKRDSRIEYLRRPKDLPKGANECRNFGFKKSRGDHILWFDDDDILLPHYLEEIHNCISKEIDVIISRGEFVDNTLKKLGPMKMNLKKNLFKGLILWENQIITGSVCFKSDFLIGKDLFLEGLSRGQEAEFFTRLFYNINLTKVRFTEKPMFLYRQHNYSKSFEDKYYNKSFKNSRAKIALRNLKYSIELGDRELIDYLYFELRKLFFLSLKEKHFSLSRFIWRKLAFEIWKVNKKLSIAWFTYGILLLMMGRDSLRIGRGLRNSQIY